MLYATVPESEGKHTVESEGKHTVESEGKHTVESEGNHLGIDHLSSVTSYEQSLY